MYYTTKDMYVKCIIPLKTLCKMYYTTKDICKMYYTTKDICKTNVFYH